MQIIIVCIGTANENPALWQYPMCCCEYDLWVGT